jgi:hypothetical protein
MEPLRNEQQAVAQVLGPLLEADFSEHSHGLPAAMPVWASPLMDAAIAPPAFRHGRSAHKALAVMEESWNEGRRHAVECDLKSLLMTAPAVTLRAAYRQSVSLRSARHGQPRPPDEHAQGKDPVPSGARPDLMAAASRQPPLRGTSLSLLSTPLRGVGAIWWQAWSCPTAPARPRLKECRKVVRCHPCWPTSCSIRSIRNWNAPADCRLT